MYIYTHTYVYCLVNVFPARGKYFKASSKYAYKLCLLYANNNSSEKNLISELISLKRDARLTGYNRQILRQRLSRYHITYSCYLPRHAPIKKYKNHKIQVYFLSLFLSFPAELALSHKIFHRCLYVSHKRI